MTTQIQPVPTAVDSPRRRSAPSARDDRNPVQEPPGSGQRLGAVLFRYRTWTLMPLAALVVGAACFSASAEAFAGAIDPVFQAAAVVVLLLAAAIRLHVSGRSERGTSSRGVTFEAGTLVTRGTYALVRNPLYLANVLIWAGLALLVGSPAVVAIAVAVTLLQYHFIIQAEERYLAGRYGRLYADYCRRVPRWLPRPVDAARSRPVDAASRFNWTRAMFREADTLLLLVLGAWSIAGLRSGWLSEHCGAEGPADSWVLPAVAATAWLAVKWRKKVYWVRRKRMMHHEQ